MLLRMIISNVRSELNKINFKVDDIYVEKITDNRSFLNASKGEEKFFIEYYNEGCFSVLERYKEFTKYGIKMVEILAFTDKIIIRPDMSDNSTYRRIEKHDFMGENVVFSVAKLYKSLADIQDINLYDYNNLFNKNNLKFVMNYYKWNSDKTMGYIYDNFDNIKLKLDRLQKGVILKKLDLNNLVVSKENNEVYLFNFMDLERCYCYKSVREILGYIDDKYRDDFIKQIGDFTYTDELVDYIVTSVIELYLYASNKNSYGNIGDYIESVSNGRLLESCKSLVEWY